MSFGTGTKALIDQQTAILKGLREARAAMVEARPNLRDYHTRDDYEAADLYHGRGLAMLDGLIDHVARTRQRIREVGQS